LIGALSGHCRGMTYQDISHNSELESTAESAARATGRGLLWLAVAIGIVAVVLGVFLVGPFGLAIVIPALLVIWFAASWAGGGPAAGA
jgi:hypothetical protein